MDNNRRTIQDKIRGCFIGGAAGDALGYPVEFLSESQIALYWGLYGMRNFQLDGKSGKALVSDDTQMTLFTANGIIYADTRLAMHGISAAPHRYIAKSYQDWLQTQEITYDEGRDVDRKNCISWLVDVPELYNSRAPGNTCLSALREQRIKADIPFNFIDVPQNDSKGCGGVMRVAPLGLRNYHWKNIEELDKEGAEIAAITHGHSLGYMPAAVLVHIIRKIVYAEKKQTLREIVLDARETARKIFAGDRHLKELLNIIKLAVELSENNEEDIDNIHQLGEGWVAEEALAIAIYCSLKYENSFSSGIIAAVNHNGDSDSTGAITGNILGAIAGLNSIPQKWKDNLELYDVIIEIADDMFNGYADGDEEWIRKYVEIKR